MAFLGTPFIILACVGVLEWWTALPGAFLFVATAGYILFPYVTKLEAPQETVHDHVEPTAS